MKLVRHHVTRPITGLFILTLAVGFGATTSFGQAAPSVASTPSWKAEVVRIVAETLEAGRVPGATLAVAKDGQVVLEKAFGTADIENDVPVRTTTRFRTASIAKPMTAVAVLRLAEQGKIDLDAPIRTYVPTFPEKRWPVTARKLLAHLGGVRHYIRRGEASGTKEYVRLVDSLECFANDPLLHEPGSAYRYTTYGYTLLGCAIETASEMSFEEAMRDLVWKPAAMNWTCVDSHRRIIAGRARGYARLNRMMHRNLPEALRERWKVGDLVNASLHDTSMKIPGGGLRSTAGDLVRFAAAAMKDDDGLVTAEMRRSMWTKQTMSGGGTIDYGLGWQLREENGVTIVTHGGAQAGTSCMLVLVPSAKLAMAIMTNVERAPMRGVFTKISAAILGD